MRMYMCWILRMYRDVYEFIYMCTDIMCVYVYACACASVKMAMVIKAPTLMKLQRKYLQESGKCMLQESRKMYRGGEFFLSDKIAVLKINERRWAWQQQQQ